MKFENSLPQSRQIVKLPAKGPFIRTGQHDYRYSAMKWADAVFLASRENKITDILHCFLGEQVFQQGPNETVEVVAAHYDTT